MSERVFRCVDRRGEFVWWEIVVPIEGCSARFALADFTADGSWYGLTEEQRARAAKRVVKI